MRSLFRLMIVVLLGGAFTASMYGQGQPQSGAPVAPAQQGRNDQAALIRQAVASGFGRALPPVLLPDSDYIKWVLTPAQQAYAKIDGNHLKQYLKDIVAFSEKSKADGNQNWGRHAGTIYDKMTRDYVVAQFKKIGLEDVHDQPVTQACSATDFLDSRVSVFTPPA